MDLGRLNSATKYPAIPTYHTLDPGNGSLLDGTVPFEGEVVLTEKIDGTNGRIICLPDGLYVIGSREELLYARGDLVGNPALGIVDALRDLAEVLVKDLEGREGMEAVVHFLEVYGGKVTAASKEYTTKRAVGYRLFDVAKVPLEVLDWPRERIASWRDAGGQAWLNEHALRAYVLGGPWLELVPRLGTVESTKLPVGIEQTRDWLAKCLPSTRAGLDPDTKGRAEGIVLRAMDRSVVAKARVQDYDRTIRRRNYRN